MADDLRVGCFGKLPFWPEYLEYGARFATSRGLKSWLHEGRAEARLADTEDGGRRDADPDTRLRILLGFPGSPELLAGVVVDRNEGGTALFLEASRRLGERFKLDLEARGFVNADRAGRNLDLLAELSTRGRIGMVVPAAAAPAIASGSRSTRRSGSHISQLGMYQLRSPSSCIADGTRIVRTTVASRNAPYSDNVSVSLAA